MLKSVICYSMALKVKDVESEIKGETHDRQRKGRGAGQRPRATPEKQPRLSQVHWGAKILEAS